ncbi:Hypothetical predicted protein [Podarcis lilfordi]|uniref:Uncharacterized protein n=1 Tax=Podarcis lilfordi TaxID=74358 RepID=A0AA35PQ62_9SAUR|nr:Hypothetical predicted protein [Podarcis lilfordi]
MHRPRVRAAPLDAAGSTARRAELRQAAPAQVAKYCYYQRAGGPLGPPPAPHEVQPPSGHVPGLGGTEGLETKLQARILGT